MKKKETPPQTEKKQYSTWSRNRLIDSLNDKTSIVKNLEKNDKFNQETITKQKETVKNCHNFIGKKEKEISSLLDEKQKLKNKKDLLENKLNLVRKDKEYNYKVFKWISIFYLTCLFLIIIF